MQHKTLILLVLLAVFTTLATAADFQADTIKTSDGNLVVTSIGHGTLMFTFNDQIIHIDPVSMYADYSLLPKANIILITHEHGDHLDSKAIEKISQDNTKLVVTAQVAESLGEGIVMQNGDKQTVNGITIKAVPAYNIVAKRDNGQPFHPKGIGNGYVLSFGDKKVYVAGDTENIPEMAELEDIYCAFLPMNLPYTMSPEMVAAAARIIKPAILYPYHFGSTDTNELLELLKDEKQIEIRIRKLQ